MNFAETNKVQATIDNIVNEAVASGSNRVPELTQFRLIIYLISTMHLRSTEVLGLDINSFRESAHRPEFGQYGEVVIRLGNNSSRGFRTILNNDKSLPEMLDEQLSVTRPQLLRKADSSQNALFLGVNGGRLSSKVLRDYFLDILERAGIDGAPSIDDFRRLCLMRDTMAIPMLSQRNFPEGYIPTGELPSHYSQERIDTLYQQLYGNQPTN